MTRIKVANLLAGLRSGGVQVLMAPLPSPYRDPRARIFELDDDGLRTRAWRI